MVSCDESKSDGSSQKCPIDLNNIEQDIRPFPATATKIISLCKSSESHVLEITELIECEPAVGIKLLAMANSPLFATSREVTSVSHAIVLLGYESVSQIALSIATGPLFSLGDPEFLYHRVQLLRESLGCSTVCRLLARECDWAEPSEAFFGGMMLDVGKLLFLDVAPSHYSEILDQNNDIDLTQIESDTFGIDHATVGSKCGRKWGLPTAINDAIRFHHRSFAEVEPGLSKTAIAGNYLARKWSLGFLNEGLTTNPIDEIEEALSLELMTELRTEAEEVYSQVEAVLSPGAN